MSLSSRSFCKTCSSVNNAPGDCAEDEAGPADDEAGSDDEAGAIALACSSHDSRSGTCTIPDSGSETCSVPAACGGTCEFRVCGFYPTVHNRE